MTPITSFFRVGLHRKMHTPSRRALSPHGKQAYAFHQGGPCRHTDRCTNHAEGHTVAQRVADKVERIRFKRLSVAEIPGAHLEQPCADIERIARDPLQAVGSKIKRLKRLQVELRRISSQYKAGNQVDDCYVIRALAGHSPCDSEH